MTLSVQQILDEAKRRQSNDESRMALYDRCENEYFGNGGDTAGRIAYADGRPALERADSIRDSLRQRLGAPNLLMPMVDDFVSLKGDIPVMSVTPEDDSEQGRETAIKRSRILRAQWQNSNMEIQQLQAGWYLSVKGDAIYVLEPLFPPKNPNDIKTDPVYEGGLKPPGVYISVIDPRMAWPRFKSGTQRYELEDLIVAWMTDGRSAKERWPQLTCADDDTVEVFQFYSSVQKTTIAANQRVEHVEHNLGFCPAQWPRNKQTPRLGQSDIAAVLDVHEEYQTMSKVTNDSLILSTYLMTWIKGAENFPDRLPIGPGAVIPVAGDGAIGQLGPTAQPQSAQGIMQTQRQHLEQMAGSSPVRTQASIDHSNISARTVHAVQGPMESRISAFQEALGYHIKSLNAKILLMLWKLDGFKNGPMTAYTVESKWSAMGTKSQQFTDTFTPDDLDGWWRTSVEWESQSDRHENVVIGLQLQGQGIVPKTYVAQAAGIDDPEMAIKQAQEEAQTQQQPPQQDPGQVQQNAMQPSDQATSMLAGGQGGTPQPPPPGPSPGGAPPTPPDAGGPGFPPLDTAPTQPGMGTPAPMQDPQEIVQQIQSSLQGQLQGQILDATIIPGGVQVTISNWQDSRMVKQAFKPLGKVKIVIDKSGSATQTPATIGAQQ